MINNLIEILKVAQMAEVNAMGIHNDPDVILKRAKKYVDFMRSYSAEFSEIQPLSNADISQVIYPNSQRDLNKLI